MRYYVMGICTLCDILYLEVWVVVWLRSKGWSGCRDGLGSNVNKQQPEEASAAGKNGMPSLGHVTRFSESLGSRPLAF